MSLAAVKTSAALSSVKCGPLKGEAKVPGDKSISHRSLILGSQAVGRTTVHGLLEGEDVLHTAGALRAMGVGIAQEGATWVIDGVGVGGLTAPVTSLEMGNSGTSTRLLMGLVSTYPFSCTFTGDASLTKRPMARVLEPLSQMGAQYNARDGKFLPVTITGSDMAVPISYKLPVPSAQVKSAILLAGLNVRGTTSVEENPLSRDHTELMLKHFGGVIEVEPAKDGGRIVRVQGEVELKPCTIHVPSDPSSAAFLAVAALIVPGSDVLLKGVCINPLRAGLYDTLKEMGGDVTFENTRDEGGEQIADIRVKHSELKAITVPASRAPSMIDEYPVLSVAAAFAKGTTKMLGLSELKVKESNRLAAIARALEANGVDVKEGEDWLEVTGAKHVKGGGMVKTHLDHRMAMSFLVLGMASDAPVQVDDGSMIDTSFPGFASLMNRLGADIK